MQTFLQTIHEWNMLSAIVRIFLAMILGGFIGLERGFHGRAAGLRTHILVSLGACMTALTSCYVTMTLGVTADIFRLSAQVISGIGFLGAGTILIRKANVTGLTTAAGLWATAAIGLAVGYGFYLGAIACSAMCLITVTILTKFEINQKSDLQLYLEVDDANYTNFVIDQIKVLYGEHARDFNVVPSKSQIPGSLGLQAALSKKGLSQPDAVIADLCAISHVTFAVRQ